MHCSWWLQINPPAVIGTLQFSQCSTVRAVHHLMYVFVQNKRKKELYSTQSHYSVLLKVGEMVGAFSGVVKHGRNKIMLQIVMILKHL